MEMGLGVPREEIHLYFEKDDKNNIKLKRKYEGSDLTELALSTYKKMNSDLIQRRIDGFILTKKSPSCGIDKVKTIQRDNPQIVIRSAGLFAKNIMEKFPNTPIIDSGRLINKTLRENFLKGVFAHFRFQNIDRTSSSFQEFHQKYKYILMDHSTKGLKEMGQIVANATKDNIEESFEKYYEVFFETLKQEAPVQRRCNTLQHLMGYFKNHLSSDEKSEILNLLEEFREGMINHIVLLKYFDLLSKKYGVTYLNNQYYFSPYPRELKLLKEV